MRQEAEAVVDAIWKERRLAMWESRELTKVVVGLGIHNLLVQYDFPNHPRLLLEYANHRSLFNIPVDVKVDAVANHLTFVVVPPWGPSGRPKDAPEEPQKSLGADGGIDP